MGTSARQLASPALACVCAQPQEVGLAEASRALAANKMYGTHVGVGSCLAGLLWLVQVYPIALPGLGDGRKEDAPMRWHNLTSACCHLPPLLLLQVVDLAAA